jgi:repressor LexA
MKDDGILDGDHVIIKKTEIANSGDTIVAYVNDEATLKQYIPKKNHIELHPKNPQFKPIKVDKNDDFRIGGIVLAVFRSF